MKKFLQRVIRDDFAVRFIRQLHKSKMFAFKLLELQEDDPSGESVLDFLVSERIGDIGEHLWACIDFLDLQSGYRRLDCDFSIALDLLNVRRVFYEKTYGASKLQQMYRVLGAMLSLDSPKTINRMYPGCSRLEHWPFRGGKVLISETITVDGVTIPKDARGTVSNKEKETVKILWETPDVIQGTTSTLEFQSIMGTSSCVINDPETREVTSVFRINGYC